MIIYVLNVNINFLDERRGHLEVIKNTIKNNWFQYLLKYIVLPFCTFVIGLTYYQEMILPKVLESGYYNTRDEKYYIMTEEERKRTLKLDEELRNRYYKIEEEHHRLRNLIGTDEEGQPK